MEHIANSCDQREQVILFVGGCHVIGYPVGIDHGFPHKCVSYLREYGKRYALAALPYIKNTRVDLIVAKVEEVGPEMIVLQLGHFELTGGVSQERISKNQMQSRSSERPSSGSFGVASRRVLWEVKNVVKFCLSLFGGGPKIDWIAFEAEFDSCVRALREKFDGPVVLLSPFDCADSVVRRIRSKAIPVYIRLSVRYNLIYVDAATMFLSKGARRLGHFDGIHLDQVGHEWIARRVIDTLVERGAIERSGTLL